MSQDSRAVGGDGNPEQMEAVLSKRVSKEGPPNVGNLYSTHVRHNELTAAGTQNLKYKQNLVTQKKTA